MITKELLEEMKKIRVRLTQIYYKELGNPKRMTPDILLIQEINKLEQELGVNNDSKNL